MADVTVVLKDGRTFCGPVWEYRPSERWFTLVLDEPGAPTVFRFDDCASAVLRQERVGRTPDGSARLADVDLLTGGEL